MATEPFAAVGRDPQWLPAEVAAGGQPAATVGSIW